MFNNNSESSKLQIEGIKKYAKITAGVVVVGFLMFGAISSAVVNDNQVVTGILSSIGADNFIKSTKSNHLNQVLEQTDEFYNSETIKLKGSIYAAFPVPIFMEVSESKQLKILEDLFVDGKLSDIITSQGTLEEVYLNAEPDLKKLLISAVQEVKYRYSSSDHRQRYEISLSTQRIQTLLGFDSNIENEISTVQDTITSLNSINTTNIKI